ncbi:hypothetical protein HYG81_22715 (plasmid) [Natrinema zhouii]|uniref:hypothetical protein n=1 Tax=Natrinema zhouii TaxID=1710539 RepID=UPI001D0001D0|nr:hypothetical protein [Natrinema zhouii]UHQ98770.1 hypothetical protein HYG81_22715 [Natrinema zhouii]
MHRLTAVAITALVLVSVLSAGSSVAATTATTQFRDTTTGISYGQVTDSNIENFDKIKSTLEQFGIEPPSETTVVIDSNNDRHIVLSSDPIPAGEATIDGRSFSTGEVSGSIIVADDFEVKTRGTPVSFDDLDENPQEHEYEVVRLEASTAVVSLAAKPSSAVSSQQTIGYFAEPGGLSSDLFQEPPGELASWGMLNGSNDSAQRNGGFQIQVPESGAQAQSFSQGFWGEGVAAIDIAIVPIYGPSGDVSEPTGYDIVLVDVNYDSQTLDSPAEIRSGNYEGEIVTVESDLAGSSTSSQEYLTSVASCGDKSVAVPMSPPICVPVTHDIVVHSGVLVDGTSLGEMPITYAGVSNKIQSVPTVTEIGRYEMTGEVVGTSEIDSSLEGGYALRVFDMERVGDASIASSFEADADRVEQRIKAQFEFDDSEWGQGRDSDEGTDGSQENTDGSGEPTEEQSSDGGENAVNPSSGSDGGDGGGSDSSEDGETSNEITSDSSTNSFIASWTVSDIGAFLGVISAAVFLLGVVLEGARGFKNRYGSEEPVLTEQMTTAIVASASAGMLIGGFLLESDVSLLLLLFGSVGVLTFVGDYLIRSALLLTLKQNLNLEGEEKKSVRIVGGVVLLLGGLALVAIVGSVLLPGPALPIVLQVLFAVMSTIVVLFGSIVGGIRFYKKYLTEDTLNTAGDMGLAITFTGSIGMATAGFLGESIFGERFILMGGVLFFVCFIVSTVKIVYRIV